jgi:hypothetical protein
VHFLYRRLLELRREDPILQGPTAVEARAEGPLLEVVRRSEAGTRALLVNFSAQPISIASFAGGTILLTTCHLPETPTELPGFGAVIFSRG